MYSEQYLLDGKIKFVLYIKNDYNLIQLVKVIPYFLEIDQSQSDHLDDLPAD